MLNSPLSDNELVPLELLQSPHVGLAGIHRGLLLGAGAGGLSPEIVIDSLTRGLKETSNTDSRLVIYILDEGVFRRVSSSPARNSRGKLSSERASGTLRVFISYCHSSPNHERWVEELGRSLRKNGIDARLDIWHLRRGMDLPQCMTNELALS